MWEIIKSGGWLMLPIIICSAMAMAIIAERLWTLRRRRVVPPHLVAQVWNWDRKGELDRERINQLRASSPLGRVLAAGLVNRNRPREIMKEAIEETGRHEIHELERFLSALGTVAAVTPLLGLLGSVVGLMEVFNTMTTQGIGNPQALGSGISKIMIATAAGLTVAIPALIFYRYFQRWVDELAILMEQEALKLVAVMVGERDLSDLREASQNPLDTPLQRTRK